MNPNVNDDLWMSMAVALANASTCRVRVGCVLVQSKEYVGGGYVGSVPGDVHCNVDECLLVDNHGLKGSSNSGKSCIRTVHAETNAVLRCKVRGTLEHPITAYCTHQPCLECTKALVAIGVRRIVYLHEYRDVHRDTYVNALKFNASFILHTSKYAKENS